MIVIVIKIKMHFDPHHSGTKEAFIHSTFKLNFSFLKNK